MDRRTKISTSLFFIRHLSREKLMPACAPHIIMAQPRQAQSQAGAARQKPHYTNVEQYILRKFKFVVFASLHLSAAGVVVFVARPSLQSIEWFRTQETQQSTTTTITNKYYYYYYLLSQPEKVRGREEISLFTSG